MADVETTDSDAASLDGGTEDESITRGRKFGAGLVAVVLFLFGLTQSLPGAYGLAEIAGGILGPALGALVVFYVLTQI